HFRLNLSVDNPSSAATRPPDDFVIVSPTVTGRRLETMIRLVRTLTIELSRKRWIERGKFFAAQVLRSNSLSTACDLQLPQHTNANVHQSQVTLPLTLSGARTPSPR